MLSSGYIVRDVFTDMNYLSISSVHFSVGIYVKYCLSLAIDPKVVRGDIQTGNK